jgi:hypothetical protein
MVGGEAFTKGVKGAGADIPEYDSESA